MFGKQTPDVLIVGAGPTGLFTALQLAEAQVPVRLIDKHWRTGAHSYALALHPRSLDLLHERRLAEPLIAKGRRVESVVIWENGQRRAELQLSDLDAKHPFALVLPQSDLEGELEDRLIGHKVKLLWNHRLEGFREDGETVVVEVAHLDQVAAGYPIARSEWTVVKNSKMQAQFLVGADGYHSQVRERLGLRYEQFAPIDTYSVFEFETEDDAGSALNVLFDGALTSVLWPMVGKRCRWSFQISHPNQHERTLGRLNEFIRTRASWFPQVRGDVHWSSMVQFDRRLAAGLGRSRVWLAGDAAHLTSPVGVQSMNAGLVDANLVAGRLIDVFSGERTADHLASYETDRMPELRRLFGDPAALPAPDGAPDWARRLWPRIVSSLPATGAHLDALLARLNG